MGSLDRLQGPGVAWMSGEREKSRKSSTFLTLSLKTDQTLESRM